MKETKYARIGEEVLVVDPIEFIRCGYRLSVKSLLKDRQSHINTQVYRAAKGAGLDHEDKHVRSHLERAICFDIMKKEDFGGRERIIVEEKVDPTGYYFWGPVIYAGAVLKVVGKKTVCTGTYKSGWWYSDYWTGEGDGEYPSLEDRKSHVVYQVTTPNDTVTPKWILAKHTRKMSEINELIAEGEKFASVVKELDRFERKENHV